MSLNVVLHLLPLLLLRWIYSGNFTLRRQCMPSKALLDTVLFWAHHLDAIVCVPAPHLRIYLPIYLSDYVLDLLVSIL